MSILKKMFSPEKPKSCMDEINSILVGAYRRLAVINGTAPTSNTSDNKIVEIYSKVLTAFRNESHKKGEFIPADILNLIAYKFLQAYELTGEDFMNEHLEYEINLYRKSGLREDYKKGLELFNSNDNERISKIQNIVREHLKNR